MKTTVRIAEEKDAEQLVTWLLNTPQNMFDPDIASYPSLRTLAVDQDDKTVVYAPFHPVFAVESLAHKPDITPKENAIALRKVQDALEELARVYGIREIYWMCRDENLVKFAERHGYEVLKCAVLRKKVDPQ